MADLNNEGFFASGDRRNGGESAHTPGPWTMETVRTSCGVVFKVGPFPYKRGTFNHACIYVDYPSTVEHAQGVANARLISHAPDLLAFVREYLEAWDDGMAGDSYLYRAAEKLIAKATGSAS